MKGRLLVGMFAGGMIGAAAAMIAMPYIQPQWNKLMNQGKQMLSKKLNEMNQQKGA